MADYNELRENAIETSILALDRIRSRFESLDESELGNTKDFYHVAAVLQSVVRLLDHCDIRNKVEEIERRIAEVNSNDNLNEMVIDLRSAGGRLKKTEGGSYKLGKAKTTSLARKD